MQKITLDICCWKPKATKFKIGRFSEMGGSLLLLFFFFSLSGWTQSCPPDPGEVCIDGNPGDWPSVATAYPYPSGSYLLDRQNDPLDDIWTGGSADVDFIADWTTTTGTSNDKNDIKNSGAVSIGSVIYFYADRYANNGDSDLGFWLLQGPIDRTATGFIGEHKDGDILLRTHFTNGGGKAERAVFIWLDGEAVQVELPVSALDFKSNPADITPVPPEWEYTPKSGTANTYPVNSFIEGFLNLAALEAAVEAMNSQFELDPCFSYFIISTGNSQAVTSSLEDVVSGKYGSKPEAKTLTGNTFCSADPIGGIVTVADSESTVSYQLQQLVDEIYVNIGSPQSGDGNEIAFTGLEEGTYFVKAYIGATGCETIIGPVSVQENSLDPGSIAGAQTICEGDDPLAFTSVAASGDGVITYQWQVSTDGSIFGDITGATSETYDPGTLSVDSWYKRIATSTLDGEVCSEESNVIEVDVNSLDPGSIAGAQTICLGDDPLAFTSVAASGDGVITYQWQVSTDGSIFGDITGATSETYDPGMLSVDSWYKRIAMSTLNGIVCMESTNILLITAQECITCETAFAKTESGIANCFIDDALESNPTSERWGWTNQYDGTASFTDTLILYAGAGQCDDTSKGVEAGEVIINYDYESGTVTVTYDMTAYGYVMSSAHLYVGCEPYPITKKGKTSEPTVAPGQYPFKSSSPGYFDRFEPDPIYVGRGTFYVIAHADVCTSENNENLEYYPQLTSNSEIQLLQARKNTMLQSSCTSQATRNSKTNEVAQDQSLELAVVSSDVTVYPVPFTEVINIAYQFDYVSDVQIEIFDFKGKLLKTVYDTSVTAGSVTEIQVDFSLFANQSYILQIKTNRDKFVRQIISGRK